MILSLLRYSHQLPTEIRYANRQKIEEIQLISLVSDLIVMYLHLILLYVRNQVSSREERANHSVQRRE